MVAVRVTPRSNRDAIEGVDPEGALRARVGAPPVEGAANKAVIRLVARDLGVPKGAVTVVAGAGARHKRLRIEGVSAARVARQWPGANVTTR